MPESATKRIGASLHKVIVLAGVGIAALGAAYLALTGPDSATGMLYRSAADRIDLYVEQPHITKFNERGRLIETLNATHMEHRLKSNQSLLQSPHFRLFTERGATWDGTAMTATILGNEQVQMRDKVVVVDAPGTQRLTTEQLDYFPQDEKVSSSARVTFRRPTDTTRALGLRADLNTNRIELLSRVEGVHVAP